MPSKIYPELSNLTLYSIEVIQLIIYIITNKVNGNQYVGQTIRSLETRLSDHKKSAELGENYYLYCAIRKHGWINFEARVIDDSATTLDELNTLETKYIKEYHTHYSEGGYNMNYGGDTNTMFSPVVAQKHRKRMQSNDVRSRISATMKRVRANQSEAERAIHSEHVSQGLKEFYAAGKRPNYKQPQHLSPAHYKALNDAKNKGVYCVNESGEVVAQFDRVMDATYWLFYEKGIRTRPKGTKILTNHRELDDIIKYSYDNDKYVYGLKWVYRV